MLFHDCKWNNGPSHSSFVQAHESVGMPGLSYKPAEFTKDHALPLLLRPQSAAPHHLALCSQLVAPRRAGGTLSAAAAAAEWERRLCCQGPLPQACWAAGAGHVPDTSSPIVPQPTLTSRGISPRGRTAAARRRRGDSGHATGCAAQSRQGNTAAGATPAGAALPCVPPGSSLVPPAPLLTKLAGTQVLHDGLRLHLVVTRGTHSRSWQEKRREEAVRSQLKKRRSTRLSECCPRGGHTPGQPATGSQPHGTAAVGIKSHPPLTGHGQPPPAAPGTGSCQEREDGAGRQRGFRGQAPGWAATRRRGWPTAR